MWSERAHANKCVTSDEMNNLWRIQCTKNNPGREKKSKPTMFHKQQQQKCYINHFSLGRTVVETTLKSQWLTKAKIYFLFLYYMSTASSMQLWLKQLLFGTCHSWQKGEKT